MRSIAFFLGQPWSDDVGPKEVYDNVIRDVQLAEELGYYGAWFGEHHFIGNYASFPNTLTLIAALSQSTNRIRLGSGCVVLPLHNPVRVAEELAMVDILSNGRLEPAIGRGRFVVEYAGMSVPIEETHERYAEGLDLLLRLFNETDVEFEGEYWNLSYPTTVLPRPIQSPYPPLWLTAGSASSIGIALDRGMNVVTYAGISRLDRFYEFHETFLRECNQRGLDPRQQRFGVQMWANHATTPTEVERGADAARWVMRMSARMRGEEGTVEAGYVDISVPDPDEPSTEEIVEANLIGDRDHLESQIGMLKDKGVSDLVLIFDTGDTSPKERRENMQVFAELLGH